MAHAWGPNRRPNRRPKYACCRNYYQAVALFCGVNALGHLLSAEPSPPRCATISLTNLNSLEFLYQGRPSCYIFHIQFFVQAPITTIAACQDTQLVLAVPSSGKLFPNVLKKRKLTQNVWVMYLRDLEVGRQR